MKIINESHNLSLKESFAIERIRQSADHRLTEEKMTDMVIVEHHLNAYINDQLAFKLVCSPEKLDALVLGFLLSEGYIKNPDEIEFIYVCESGERVKAQLYKPLPLPEIDHDTGSNSISCGNNRKIRQAAYAKSLMPLPVHDWSPETVLMLANACNHNAGLFAETGGTHCCAMSIRDKLAFICEDIGRHNAVDKTIGQAMIEEKNIAEAILFTTGRIPSDMVIKAIRSRIPVIASHSAPTDEAVLLARQFNLTLIGFVRGKRMNLYAGK
ncbi:formate dehydrogenase accessory sulfurtransferase FdhD [Acetobacterium wieringae]|uniref:Formate dehydrogenase accessory sulfurtransferase FdhD n=1 Tax=Acetobacterium wieringae TaxID=52694 RepID=A0A5D0WJ52_9FIRM|nr:formate dehydrogenase accessory sulfurtransferase FdhD [Acetobacterium wieringae]TYC84306.1 formate dehydrogenase accessory sulfurtransferase FdhD [Acetobacterium wieringae]